MNASKRWSAPRTTHLPRHPGVNKPKERQNRIVGYFTCLICVPETVSRDRSKWPCRDPTTSCAGRHFASTAKAPNIAPGPSTGRRLVLESLLVQPPRPKANERARWRPFIGALASGANHSTYGLALRLLHIPNCYRTKVSPCLSERRLLAGCTLEVVLVRKWK